MTMTVALGDVDADLDDSGGDEDVGVAALEAGHGDLLVVSVHAAVEKGETEAGKSAVAELFVHVGG